MTTKPQLWGGFECSVVRVGAEYRDQFEETGHARRPEDIDAAADLGLQKLRYPVLWETICPDSPQNCNWRWHDQRLQHVRDSGLEIIAGFSHHGSGPRYTHLLDPDFPRLFSAFAAEVAARYPWITDFTPINEPLTTARFSCLYGHWYPHERSEAAFLRSLFIQCHAIAMAMLSVRSITPNARLIQTEDLGRVFGTPPVSDQVDYENERRWLSWDLLSGKVAPDHPFYERFVRSGVSERQLLGLFEDPCIPDVFGVNHYLTSDRFLDDDTTGYPPDTVGGNGRQTYADVAAVRVPGLDGETGFEPRLREVWKRYGRPLALTEVHNGCTREDQLRWLSEAWTGAQKLCSEGIPVEGFTVWSLVGAVDWTSLLTERRGHYETGVFDVRSGKPRPTVLASAIRQMAGTKLQHAVLDGPGWWKRQNRFLRPVAQPFVHSSSGAPILLTGKTGTLGQAFSRICTQRGLQHILLGRHELDIASEEQTQEALTAYKPWAIVNAAGFVRVAEAAHNKEQCLRENGTGAATLARIAAQQKIPLVTFSSDLVFDGKAGRPYLETDTPAPQCVYGESKAIAEREVLNLHKDALVVRTSAFFSPWDTYNFAWAVLSALSEGKPFHAQTHKVISPTFVPDLVNAVLDLLIDDANGVWHVSNQGSLSWYDFACRVAVAAGCEPGLIHPQRSDDVINTALTSAKGVRLPELDHAIARFVAELPEPYARASSR